MRAAGQLLGGYRILSTMGAGGVGEVYLAAPPDGARKVVLEVLPAQLGADARALARLATEARATADLRHPAIGEVLACDVAEDGRTYVAREHLEGETLAALLTRSGSFAAEVGTAVAVIGRVASGLAAAHQQGVIHRDIRPENLFLVHRGPTAGSFPGVKILGFGMARFVAMSPGAHGGDGRFTRPTPYMAPEQCRTGGAVDARADLYGLGCVLYEMLCGRPPFDRASPSGLIASHLARSAPRASEIHRGLPPGLDDLLARLLARDPAQRPASAEDLIAALERCTGVLRSGQEEIMRVSPLLAAARESWSTASTTPTPAARTTPTASATRPSLPDLRPPAPEEITAIMPAGRRPSGARPVAATPPPPAIELSRPRRTARLLTVAVVVAIAAAAGWLQLHSPRRADPPASHPR